MSHRRAFTLMELLVVITIIVLVSAVTLPGIIGAVSHRGVSEAARIVQAQLVQARDTAIRFNAPRGVRFLPDPTYNFATTGILAYNRMVPIEPAPEYSNGMATIWPSPAVFTGGAWHNQPWAPTTLGTDAYGVMMPIYPQGHPNNPMIGGYAGQVLMVEQAPFQKNDTGQFINAPTSWYWNIRVGDKIQLGGAGQTYTVVGPCKVNPNSSGGQNPEMFVNVGQPGDLSTATSWTLYRTYTTASAANPVQVPVDYLYLVNGKDDDGDGYTDEGFDGIDNNDRFNNGTAWVPYGYNAVADDQSSGSSTMSTEWEPEKWLGTVASSVSSPGPYTTNPDTTVSTISSGVFSLPAPMSYVITRRPVPSQSARETMLPRDVVIDATMALAVPKTGGGTIRTNERSRLPGIDPFSGSMDVLLLPSGQVVPTTLYSNPASFSLGNDFYHFWIAERADVHPPTDLWGLTANSSSTPPWFANGNPNAKLSFQLPMPQDAYTAYGLSNFTTQPQTALKGERMMLTLFGRTGQITTNSIEFFDCDDLNTPFYDSELGAREAK